MSPLLRPLLIVALLVVVAGVLLMCSNHESGPIDGNEAMKHVEKIVGFGERPAGSLELKLCGDYIQAELRKLGLEPQTQVFTDKKKARELKLPFRNIWVEIPSKTQDPKTAPILVIGSHYDSKLCRGHANAKHNFKFVGAVDGGGSSGLLIELARHLKDRRNIPNIWLVWFDGEESLDWDWGKGERALFGSRHFVKAMSKDKKRFPKGLPARMKVMVLLDLIGAKDFKIDRDTASYPKLVEIFGKAAEQMGEKDRMFRWESSMTDDHIPFRNYQVKVIDLIDLVYRGPDDAGNAPHPDYAAWWHTKDDTLDKLSAAGLKFAGDLVWLALPMIEAEFYGGPQPSKPATK